jgi:hypothetical protein
MRSPATNCLIPVHIAARRLGRSPRTIRRYIYLHLILAVRINKRAWGVWEGEIERLQREVFYGRV